MELIKEDGGLFITQRKFATETLSEFDCLEFGSVSTPLDPTVKLSSSCGPLIPDPIVYRRLLGKLNFLTNTWQDLSFTVQTLSQYMQNPFQGHLSASYHTLRYLSRAPGLDLFLSLDLSFQILAFCNSNWASSSDTGRSVSGFFLRPGGSPILWKSKKQPVIALSSDASPGFQNNLGGSIVKGSFFFSIVADFSSL